MKIKKGKKIMSPRPFMCRKISSTAPVKCFSPKGVPFCKLEKIMLNPDELESIKLADYDLLYQSDAADKMGISRQTFGNIINSAHKKIADALLNGKAICLKGECDKKVIQQFECPKCSIVWDFQQSENAKCPKCENTESIRLYQTKENLEYKPEPCCQKRHRLKQEEVK